MPMSKFKLLIKILQFKELKITWFELKSWGHELHLGVKPYKNGALCPQCQRRGQIIRQHECRSWTDLTLFGIQIILWYAPKEINCPTHGRLQEQIPWAEHNARITYRLEFRITALCQLMTQKAAAAILKMATSTLSDHLHRIIERVRADHKIRGLVTVGVDEISYRKGKLYATIVYDLDRSCVLWVGFGKGREAIDKFFLEKLSEAQRSRIKWASCDMSQAYIGGIKAHCPNATLVIDRFHVVKALNEAVDEVRKEEWRTLGADDRKAIKGLRWMLGMHSRNRTKKHSRFLNSLANSNRRIHRAWVLKDEFEHFWNYCYAGSAKKFLKYWMTTALKSRIPSLKKFVGTLRNHFDNIITYIKRPLTNAVGEGLNRVIKIVKNRSSGFRGLEPFADLIYLTVGDLNIPAQIPSKLRTL